MADAPHIFLDATPLLDEHWTGIPVVCASLARALAAEGCTLDFTLGAQALPRDAVHEALARGTGLYLAHEAETGLIPMAPIAFPARTPAIGLSASVKRLRGHFPIEASIIHDISTLLHPHFHTPENIAWHAESIVADIATNAVTLCVSDATRDHLIAYLGADPARLVTTLNGVEWPWWFAPRAAAELAHPVEPFVLVLATREPRKNLALVFEMLERNPALLEHTRFVFVGKPGWLIDQVTVPAALAPAIASGRIHHAGFVSEYEKYVLLRAAQATLFPSLFEGFGLPVAEALSVGTPCVCARSSSLPEVGGDLCAWFDPLNARAMEAALTATLAGGSKEDPRFRAACAVWVERFSWRAMARRLLRAVEPYVEAER